MRLLTGNFAGSISAGEGGGPDVAARVAPCPLECHNAKK